MLLLRRPSSYQSESASTDTTTSESSLDEEIVGLDENNDDSSTVKVGNFGVCARTNNLSDRQSENRNKLLDAVKEKLRKDHVNKVNHARQMSESELKEYLQYLNKKSTRTITPRTSVVAVQESNRPNTVSQQLSSIGGGFSSVGLVDVARDIMTQDSNSAGPNEVVDSEVAATHGGGSGLTMAFSAFQNKTEAIPGESHDIRSREFRSTLAAVNEIQVVHTTSHSQFGPTDNGMEILLKSKSEAQSTNDAGISNDALQPTLRANESAIVHSKLKSRRQREGQRRVTMWRKRSNWARSLQKTHVRNQASGAA